MMTTSSWPSSARRTSRRMPSSRIDTTGISGSGTASSAAQARSSARSAVACIVISLEAGRGLPARVRMLAREALHLGEHETHVLRVFAELAGAHVLDRRGRDERGFVERCLHVGAPRGFELRGERRDAGFGHGGFHRIRAEELARVRHQPVERGLGAAVRFLGAVAETDQPFARVMHVIARFLDRTLGDGGQLRIGGTQQRGPQMRHQRRIKEVAHDRHGVVVGRMRRAGERPEMRQLGERVVGELALGAEIGVVVLGALAAGERLVERGGVRVEQARLADQVEAHVGERDVFFEDRAVAAPFRVALTEDQRGVGEAQHVREVFLRGRRHGLALTCG
ncbi:hypothetical protein PT2222_200007 [Paraburkholderia tropica]